jgi:hypothetical protein
MFCRDAISWRSKEKAPAEEAGASLKESDIICALANNSASNGKRNHVALTRFPNHRGPGFVF